APELSFRYPFTSIRSDYRWRIMTAALGAALKFNLARETPLMVEHHEPPPSPPPAPPPPPEKPKSEIKANVKIVGVMRDSTGTEREFAVPELRVEEFVRIEAYPTLNYIFFDESSFTIPVRYHQIN